MFRCRGFHSWALLRSKHAPRSRRQMLRAGAVLTVAALLSGCAWFSPDAGMGVVGVREDLRDECRYGGERLGLGEGSVLEDLRGREEGGELLDAFLEGAKDAGGGARGASLLHRAPPEGAVARVHGWG